MYKELLCIYTVLCMCAKSPQLCLTLCDPTDCSPPGSSIHRNLQARLLQCPPLGGLPDPGIEPTSVMSPALAGEFFTTSTTWEAPASPCTEFLII